jgi:hypothetical protein
MCPEIYQWDDISYPYRDTLILGNGSSIAVSDSFNYSSLRLYIKDNKIASGSIEMLFEEFGTNDFEMILRLVWTAKTVNETIGVDDEKTVEIYNEIRQCLIEVVHSIHPEYQSIVGDFQSIANYMRRFGKVFSLNYDLLVYWVMMFSNNNQLSHRFKDCFLHNVFDEDWSNYRVPSKKYGEENVTLVFYPHGNLSLIKGIVDNEYKIAPFGGSLLDAVLCAWSDNSGTPIFVSEGGSNQKVVSIKKSNYLFRVNEEIISEPCDNITIYGWSMSDNDIHIMRKIRKSGAKRIAISVFVTGTDSDRKFCDEVTLKIKNNIGNVEIVFFDSKSPGCWNNPPNYLCNPPLIRTTYY